MPKVAEQIIEHMARLPEGTPVGAKELLHLGGRAAIDQTLSRLVRRGHLLRAGRGIYVRQIETRFGTRAPSVEKMIAALAMAKGETVATHGAAAANRLGLTTQVPVRSLFLTSGPSRRLQLGAQTVELRHAPAWQLVMPGRPAGEAVRALAWLGKDHLGDALHILRRRLSASAIRAIADARSRLPTWMAAEVSHLIENG